MSKDRVHVHWFPVYDSIEAVMDAVLDYGAIGLAFQLSVEHFNGHSSYTHAIDEIRGYCEEKAEDDGYDLDDPETQERIIKEVARAEILYRILSGWADSANEHYDEVGKKRSAAARARWKKESEKKE